MVCGKKAEYWHEHVKGFINMRLDIIGIQKQLAMYTVCSRMKEK